MVEKTPGLDRKTHHPSKHGTVRARERKAGGDGVEGHIQPSRLITGGPMGPRIGGGSKMWLKEQR